jgi:hypothetical protein
MSKGIIKDKILDGGTRYSAFEVQHESSNLIVPNWLSIAVKVHHVSVHLMVKKLIKSWLLSI